MAPTSKSIPAKDRRKSSASAASTASKIITLRVSPDRLRALIDPPSQVVKEDTPMNDVKDSPSHSTPVPADTTANPDNASDSNPATPANGGTPVPSVMGPPGDGQGPKKKGVKRTAAAANGDGLPKIRGKPGPKRRKVNDDGTVEPRTAAHRLGPKANQGAINAGLRALDRSGKPCRKWTKGTFQLKTFTGVQWEINRWVAPPKPKHTQSISEDGAPGSTPASADGSSSKENKENGGGRAVKSDNNSTSGADVEMQSLPSVQASSPAPMPIAAGA